MRETDMEMEFSANIVYPGLLNTKSKNWNEVASTEDLCVSTTVF